MILPQDEAEEFTTPDNVDARGIAERCYKQALACDIMLVVLDGSDSDSGASMEAGLRVGHIRATSGTGKTLGIRTDPRKLPDGQVNAMFQLLDGIIYFRSSSPHPGDLCDMIAGELRRWHT